MKKLVLLILMPFILGILNVSAQSELNDFEGETTAKIFNSQKMKSAVLTKNLVAKMIVKAVTKKYLDNNPALYNGAYTATTIIKGGKICVKSSNLNTVTITIPEGGKTKTICYFPYIKKGYYTYSSTDAKQAQQQLEQMRKGNVEKTGETMNIMGHKCTVYKVKYESSTDSAGMKVKTIINNEYAISNDPSLPEVNKEIIPGVHGAPLKFATNVVSQTNSDMINMDVRIAIASIVTSITPRTVADSEFEVPADIKLINIDGNEKEYFKLYSENTKYLKKNKLWVDPAINEDRIYDNLQEEWDY